MTLTQHILTIMRCNRNPQDLITNLTATKTPFHPRSIQINTPESTRIRKQKSISQIQRSCHQTEILRIRLQATKSPENTRQLLTTHLWFSSQIVTRSCLTPGAECPLPQYGASPGSHCGGSALHMGESSLVVSTH